MWQVPPQAVTRIRKRGEMREDSVALFDRRARLWSTTADLRGQIVSVSSANAEATRLCGYGVSVPSS